MVQIGSTSPPWGCQEQRLGQGPLPLPGLTLVTRGGPRGPSPSSAPCLLWLLLAFTPLGLLHNPLGYMPNSYSRTRLLCPLSTFSWLIPQRHLFISSNCLKVILESNMFSWKNLKCPIQFIPRWPAPLPRREQFCSVFGLSTWCVQEVIWHR